MFAPYAYNTRRIINNGTLLIISTRMCYTGTNICMEKLNKVDTDTLFKHGFQRYY